MADDDVREALLEAYRTGSWGQYHGRNVEQFEQELADYHGVPHIWTCSSGTFAVELALRALPVAAGDEVIIAAYDYPGNFHSVLGIGATPVLVDIDRFNWNISAAAIEAALGNRTRAIVVSHLHGGIAPVRQILEIAHRRGISVIEDAAQATGAMIHGRRAGTWGDVGTLSFGGSKLLTAGRGGCLLTASPEVHQRAKLFCNRGNNVFPLSELQAAVLRPQLGKLDARNRVRSERVHQLGEHLRGVAGLGLLQNSVGDVQPAYYKVGFQYDPNALGGLSRDRFAEAVRVEGVACDAGFRSLHVGRSTTRFRQAGPLTEATRAHDGMVVLHHPVLLSDEQSFSQVAGAIKKVAASCNQLC
jgi:dTDP-4-amino-4,6-dideoxygalactose transaminase